MANKFLVVLGAWLIQFLEVGTIKSFAVLLSHIVKDLESTTERLGMYIGLYHAVILMSGIFAKVLLNRYSPRSLSMLGGLIGSLGLMVCSKVTKPIYFAVCLFISGLGFSMVNFTSSVSVMHAFGDRYMLPFSVGLLGGGVGMMILPLLTQKLLEAYTWRGALLILGAMNLHVVLSGALFEKAILQRESPPSKCDLRETPQTRDASYKQDSSTSDLQSVGNGDRVQHHASQSDSWLFRCSRRAVELFRDARQGAGLGVFSEYPLIMYALLASYLHGISYIGWTVFVISNAEAKGFDEAIAIFLSLLGGIGNITGRMMPGLLNCLNEDIFSSKNSFILFGVIGALPLFFNEIVSRFSTLCVCATLNGLAIGAKTIVKTTTVVDVVLPSLSSTVLSFVMICFGLGEITGGWMTGRIFDLTGSMDTAFFSLGCVDIFSVVVLLLSLLHEKVLQLRSSSKEALQDRTP